MTSYVDVFVIPVPKSRLAEYKELARLAATIWQECGAVSYVEYEADDIEAGKLTSFPRSVDLKPDETLVVAVIGYNSRAERDEINARAMKDPRLTAFDPKNMPLDGKRMFWGGFKPLLDSRQT
jgi:uncharacterized protein YbaA (DUF1428 family)